MDKIEYTSFLETCYKYNAKKLERLLQIKGHEISDRQRVLDLASMGLPIDLFYKACTEDFQDKAVMEFKAKGKIQETKKAISLKSLMKKYIKSFEEVATKGYSLYFYGSNSLGKSFAAVRLMKALYDRYNCQGQYYSYYYITYIDLYEMRNKAYNNDFEEIMLDVIQNVDFLIIDEIGKENKVNDSVIVFFETFLKYRTQNGLPTVGIGNLKPYADLDSGNPSIYSKYGMSCYEAMVEKYRFFGFSVNKNDNQREARTWQL